MRSYPVSKVGSDMSTLPSVASKQKRSMVKHVNVDPTVGGLPFLLGVIDVRAHTPELIVEIEYKGGRVLLRTVFKSVENGGSIPHQASKVG